MLKTILVPLDGSTRAERALPLAARLASNAGATIILVRVASLAAEFWPTIMTPYPKAMQTVVDAELEEASAYLTQCASTRLLEELEVKTVVRYGQVVPNILVTATTFGADMILVCSHGYSRMKSSLMGSVAERLAHAALVPVLILREGDLFPGEDCSDSHLSVRVLVPLDGTEQAKAALEPAAQVAAALSSKSQRSALHLARIVAPGGTRAEEAEELARAKRYLSSICEEIRQGALAPSATERQMIVTWSVACDSNITEALLKIAEMGEDAEGTAVFGGCDLIALAVQKKRNGWHNFRVGGVAERLVHESRHPVLVVRAEEVAEKREVQQPSDHALHM